MKRIVALAVLTGALLLVHAHPVRAQPLAEANGIWYGTLIVPNISPLRIVIELYTRPSGAPGADFISIDEGGGAVVATDISLEDNALRLFMRPINIVYTGQVDLAKNRIEAGLQAAGNNDVTLVELSDLNHLFQHAKTGALDEYLGIAETFSPEALRLTANWLRERAGLPPLDDTAVREEQLTSRPQDLTLAQNYPNPFNSGTAIGYSLKNSGSVSLYIYNAAGQKVATLVEGERASGSYALAWDARDAVGQPLASGLYFYQLRTPNGVQTRQMIVLR